MPKTPYILDSFQLDGNGQMRKPRDERLDTQRFAHLLSLFLWPLTFGEDSVDQDKWLSLMIANTAPCGSAMVEKRPTFGMSVGGTKRFAPSDFAWLALASQSSTAK